MMTANEQALVGFVAVLVIAALIALGVTAFKSGDRR